MQGRLSLRISPHALCEEPTFASSMVVLHCAGLGEWSSYDMRKPLGCRYGD